MLRRSSFVILLVAAGSWSVAYAQTENVHDAAMGPNRVQPLIGLP